MQTHLTIHNKRLHCRWIGDFSNRQTSVLVLLHEGLGCIELWKNVPEELAAMTGLPVFLYERQGYGKSDAMALPRPFDYLEQEAFDWLPQVLQAAQIAQPPILFGHSDGGSIALLYASRYPVRALISESAHVMVEDVTLRGVEQAKDIYAQIRPKLLRYHGDKTDDLFRAWADTWLHPRFVDWNIESYLPSVHCPSLIIQGADDEYASPAHVERIVNGLGTAHKQGLIVPDSAHIPHLQAKQTTLEAIAAFIAEHLHSRPTK